MGAALQCRFERAGDDADLDAPIEASRRAAELAPPDFSDLPQILSNLGGALFARFQHTGDIADLDAAIEYWRVTSEMPTAAASVRLNAAGKWGAAAADAGRMPDAVQGYSAAVSLLPLVAWHGLDLATRERQLAQLTGLAAEAAACAVLAGRPEHAVELLEQSRSVLWTQALALRGDLTRLAEAAPDLAKRLDDIRTALDSALPQADLLPECPGNGARDADLGRRQRNVADLRRQMAREWDEVLAQARKIAGFEHFLTAVNTMLRALADTDRPSQTAEDSEKGRNDILNILEWLWDVIAEPVLTELGYTGTPATGDPWPRVWWCPAGLMTLFPVHAAGHHPRPDSTLNGSGNCVLDRVVSAYTPTLAALARARQPAPAAQVRQLTIGMAATPGLARLKAVPAKVDVLARHFPPGKDNHQLTGAQATRAHVLAALGSRSWVHFACHAGAHHDPARSGFALWDATLTVADLIAQQPSAGI
jgi:tetratricopeptide (TPR) repeat protein